MPRLRVVSAEKVKRVRVRLALLTAMLIVGSVSMATAADNDTAPVDVDKLCQTALLLCWNACDSARLTETQAAECTSKCDNYNDCVGPATRAGAKPGGAAARPPTGAVLETGPSRPAKRPHPGAPATGGVLRQ